MQGLIGLILLSNSALADTPLPDIHEPEGKGVKCIQPEDEIRRNHMKYILHERNETMHEGIRDEPESLANCINCHIFPDKNGVVPRIDSKDHFDIGDGAFQCHADRPQKYIDRDKQASQHQQSNTLSARADSGEGVNQ